MPKKQRQEALKLAVAIRDFHRRNHRLLSCRRAYDITMAALVILYPVVPDAKKRGVRVVRSVASASAE
jgi:hypothetical protein